MAYKKETFNKSIDNIKNIDLNSMEWMDILDILEEVDKSTVRNLMPILPCLLKHRAWPVRAEAVEIVGNFGIKPFEQIVKERLHDKNKHVKAYALAALYDLKKHKALKYIKSFVKDENIGVRINALTLLFIEKKSPGILNKIKKTVTRENCDYHHQFNVINQFNHYLKIKNYPEIIKLYKDILQNTSPSSGVAKELKGVLGKA